MATRKKATKKKAAKKKATKKKGTKKKATKKKAAKKPARKKAAKKKAAKKPARKKATKKKAAKKPARKKATKKKTAKKPARKKKSARKPSAAFMAPLQPDAALSAVVGSKPLARTEVVKKLWKYIKKNDLQHSTNRRVIVADAKLKPVFGGKRQVDMFQMTKLVSKHLN
jgi:chromatin remodeling complex protein RSC6